MASKKKLLSDWWDGLTEAEREAAKESLRAGTLDDRVAKGLERRGIIAPGMGGKPLPDDVEIFLKMRH